MVPFVDTLRTEDEIREAMQKSNRPLIDSRSEEEVALFNRMVQESKEQDADRSEYQLILQHLPLLAPKSFSGYRRMKKANSKNFQALKVAAEAAGIALS